MRSVLAGRIFLPDWQFAAPKRPPIRPENLPESLARPYRKIAAEISRPQHIVARIFAPTKTHGAMYTRPVKKAEKGRKVLTTRRDGDKITTLFQRYAE